MTYKYHKLLIKAGIFTLAAIISTNVNSVIIDSPKFKIGGVVVVWGGDGTGNATVADLIIDFGSGNLDLIAGDVQPVITGSLQQFSGAETNLLEVSGQALVDGGQIGVLDAGDSFSAFSPTESVTATINKLQSSFYIASNTAFSIKAQATLDVANSNVTAGLEDIYRTLSVKLSGTDGPISYGSAAQFPHTDSNPIAGVANNGFMNNLSVERLVFEGNRRTALNAGTIAEQSVRFTNTYEIPNYFGFEKGVKSVAANVVYTVAIP